MKLHKSEEQTGALDLMRKKVNNELLCLKEKTKEELNLWSGLTTKFVMIKAFSDHLANTVELIEKQSLEAERSKSLLEGTMSEQLIFLSSATLQISDFSADLSYSEHERALCALHHGKLRDELKDLEECLAQAVSEAADMTKYKEMIEGQLIAAKEISNRDEAMLLRIQESLLSNTEEAEHRCQSERLIGSERSSTTVEKLSFQVAELQAIRMSLQSQVEEHTSYATYLEHCLASRREVTEDKLDALQAVLEATQRKTLQASLEIQTLNQVIGTLKEQDDESAALVANLRQEVAEAKDTLNKHIEEMAYQKAVEAVEVQNLNEMIGTLKDQNDESAALVANLRQEVAEAKDTLNKQVEETAQRMAMEAAEVQNLNEVIGTLKDQNDESAALVVNLQQEVAEAKDRLNKQVEETAQRMAVEAAEVQNLNEVIRTLKEQNAESAALVANLRQEVAEAKDTLNKHVEETAQRMAVEAAEFQNLNEVIRTLKEQNAESAGLVQNAAECCANLKQELVEAKDALNKQVEESAQRMAAKTVEVQNLNEVIRTLKEQNAESAELVQNAVECCANLKQELVEAKDALNKQVEESAQRMAAKTVEVQNLNKVIRTLKEQNAESAKLVANLRQEVAEAQDALNKQVEEAVQRKTVEAVEVQNLNEAMKILKEQNDESAALVANLKQEVAEAKDSLNKEVQEAAQRKAVEAAEVHNLNEVIRTLKEQNAESVALVARLRQEVAEAQDTLNKQADETAQRKAVEVQNLNEVIRTLREQNAESAELVASLRQEVAEAQDALNKQVEETVQRKTVEAVEVQNLNEAIRTLREQNVESAELVAILRQEVAEAQDALNKQVEETVQRKTVEAVEVQNLNEAMKILKEQNDESTALTVKLRQEVTEAQDALNKQVEETAQRKALEAIEVQNLHELIRTLKEQNGESSALVVNLRQEVAEAKENINNHPEEMEVEFCRSLLDDSHHTFKDLSDLMSWYTSDVLEECTENESAVRSVESNPLRDLIISFRGQHLPDLKRLGAHLKYAMVASVSAYTKLIEDSLQEKENLKNEISNLQTKSYQLCHQMVTAEKSLMDLKIQSESDLRAKEDALTRHLKEISQRNEQEIIEMRKPYESKKREYMSLETPKAEQESQPIKDTRNAKSDYIAQNVANMGMNQQTPRHTPDNCAEGSALNGLQSTRKDVKMKASNEPQPKRLKAINTAGGDSINVIVTKNKGRRSFRDKAADDNNGRQTFDRRCKEKNRMIEQEEPQSERLSQIKRLTSLNMKSRPALQQSRAKDSPSSGLGDMFLDSLLDTYKDLDDDPYAFV